MVKIITGTWDFLFSRERFWDRRLSTPFCWRIWAGAEAGSGRCHCDVLGPGGAGQEVCPHSASSAVLPPPNPGASSVCRKPATLSGDRGSMPRAPLGCYETRVPATLIHAGRMLNTMHLTSQGCPQVRRGAACTPDLGWTLWPL